MMSTFSLVCTALLGYTGYTVYRDWAIYQHTWGFYKYANEHDPAGEAGMFDNGGAWKGPIYEAVDPAGNKHYILGNMHTLGRWYLKNLHRGLKPFLKNRGIENVYVEVGSWKGTIFLKAANMGMTGTEEVFGFDEHHFETKLMQSLAFDENFNGPDGQSKLSFWSLEDGTVRAMAEKHAQREVKLHVKGSCPNNHHSQRECRDAGFLWWGKCDLWSDVPESCKMQDWEKHMPTAAEMNKTYKEGKGTKTIFKRFQWTKDNLCPMGDCTICDRLHRFDIWLAYRNDHWATKLTHHTRQDPRPCLIVCGMSHVFKRGEKKFSVLTYLETAGWRITPLHGGLEIPALPVVTSDDGSTVAYM